MTSRALPLAVLAALAGSVLADEKLTVIGFNVESGDSEPETVGRVVDLYDGCDVWGFSEVQERSWAETFARAAERGRSVDYRWILGETGGKDRLVILYNTSKLELVDSFELRRVQVQDAYRAPLVARFRLRASSRQFLFLVNHLARGEAGIRHEQSQRLNRWLRDQSEPVVAVGDYNYDWDWKTGGADHDRGYDELTRDGVVRWVRPIRFMNTHCGSYDRILDFVFVGGAARRWSALSAVLAPHVGSCPDDHQSSDHRPVMGQFLVR